MATRLTSRFRNLSPRSWFYVALIASLIAKIWIAFALPLTGDEVYYVTWGFFPQGGYYDQPPMIGWWLSLLSWAAPSPVLLRLPAILLSAGIVPFLLRWLKPSGQARAYWIGILFLLSPIQLLFVILTTDIPLIFFSVLCVDTFWRALNARTQEFQNLWASLAGVFLGLAFLSKYFALLLPLCFLIYAVFLKRDILRLIVLMSVVALPFGLQHLAWNSQNCWANLVFNLYSRHAGEEFELKKPLLWMFYQIYLLTPPLLVLWLRTRPGLWRGLFRSPFALLAVCTAVPLTLFGVSSLKYGQGLHWTLTYYVFFFALSGVVFSERQLKTAARGMLALTLAHLGVFGWLASRDDGGWRALVQNPGSFKGVQMFRHAPELWKRAQSYGASHIVTADGYTLASLLSVQSRGRHIPIFGGGSRYGRFDDMLTDVRTWDGRDVAIFTHHDRQPSEFDSFFSRVTREAFEVGGATFYVLLGEGFRAERYRQTVLEPVLANYYPKSPLDRFGRCELRDRYRPPHPTLNANR